jgi:hypothetical protein
MKNSQYIFLLFSLLSILSCNNNSKNENAETPTPKIEQQMAMDDGRTSLDLNPMQKNHQLSNMRSHLEAVQQITVLLSTEKYDEASQIAYTKLGSTTEMRLMCASFGNKDFENLGLEFHKSADLMSEVFKKQDKNESLQALSNTLNYCVQCHKTYKQ